MSDKKISKNEFMCELLTDLKRWLVPVLLDKDTNRGHIVRAKEAIDIKFNHILQNEEIK